MHQRGRTYGSPPLDSPTPVGMLYGDVPTLAEVSIRRKDAFREALCVRAHTRRYVHWNCFLGRLTIGRPAPAALRASRWERLWYKWLLE